MAILILYRTHQHRLHFTDWAALRFRKPSRPRTPHTTIQMCIRDRLYSFPILYKMYVTSWRSQVGKRLVINRLQTVGSAIKAKAETGRQHSSPANICNHVNMRDVFRQQMREFKVNLYTLVISVRQIIFFTIKLQKKNRLNSESVSTNDFRYGVSLKTTTYHFSTNIYLILLLHWVGTNKRMS